MILPQSSMLLVDMKQNKKGYRHEKCCSPNVIYYMYEHYIHLFNILQNYGGTEVTCVCFYLSRAHDILRVK